MSRSRWVYWRQCASFVVLGIIIITTLRRVYYFQDGAQDDEAVIEGKKGEAHEAVATVEKDERTCEASPTANVTTRGFPLDPIPLSDFLEGPGLADTFNRNQTKTAVCEFRRNGYTAHFPHAMQQLYSCWSWWKANPDKVAVLAGPVAHKNDTSFLPGFLEGLEEGLGVRTINISDIEEKELGGIVNSQGIGLGGVGYAMRTEDARPLADGMMSYYGLAPALGCGLAATIEDGDEDLIAPRIAILNRNPRPSGRSILNAHLVANRLREAVLQGKSDVRVVTFDAKSFSEQIEWYASVDIVISVHGAQLTGVPFMPACAAVIEVFPTGYYIPWFFGTLVESAGLLYYPLYYSTGDIEAENAIGLKDINSRVAARGANLCPEPDSIVRAVKTVIEGWRQCCQEKEVTAINSTKTL